MICTGKRCPMQFGFDIKRCTANDCPYRTKPMTNADWIRSMTEKELAEFIGHNSLCDRVQGEGGNWCNDHNCTDCLEEWLKQPAEDDC